jgi:hypothetical protein
VRLTRFGGQGDRCCFDEVFPLAPNGGLVPLDVETTCPAWVASEAGASSADLQEVLRGDARRGTDAKELNVYDSTLGNTSGVGGRT